MRLGATNLFMTEGFDNLTLDVATGNGADDVLLEPLVFVRHDRSRVRAPIGGTTDGLSTPKIIRILPGYDSTGDDWFSGVLHDAGYRDQLEILCRVTCQWVKAHFTQKQCDELIYEAMKAQGVGFMRRWTIYLALRAFGGFDFRSDRKQSAIAASSGRP